MTNALYALDIMTLYSSVLLMSFLYPVPTLVFLALLSDIVNQQAMLWPIQIKHVYPDITNKSEKWIRAILYKITSLPLSEIAVVFGDDGASVTFRRNNPMNGTTVHRANQGVNHALTTIRTGISTYKQSTSSPVVKRRYLYGGIRRSEFKG